MFNRWMPHLGIEEQCTMVMTSRPGTTCSSLLNVRKGTKKFWFGANSDLTRRRDGEEVEC